MSDFECCAGCKCGECVNCSCGCCAQCGSQKSCDCKCKCCDKCEPLGYDCECCIDCVDCDINENNKGVVKFRTCKNCY